MALPVHTSFFYACFDPNDVNHEQAKDLSIPPKSSGALSPEISVTLALPFRYPARFSGGEAGE